jgi:hypothetical protein
MGVAIHKCMESMLGISLDIYLYPNLAKTICLSYYLLCFLFNKIREEEGRTGSAWKREFRGVVEEEVAKTMYTHVSKYKNDKGREKIHLGNLLLSFH